MSVCLSVRRSVCLSVCLSVRLYVCMSVNLYVHISVSVYDVYVYISWKRSKLALPASASEREVQANWTPHFYWCVLKAYRVIHVYAERERETFLQCNSGMQVSSQGKREQKSEGLRDLVNQGLDLLGNHLASEKKDWFSLPVLAILWLLADSLQDILAMRPFRQAVLELFMSRVSVPIDSHSPQHPMLIKPFVPSKLILLVSANQIYTHQGVLSRLRPNETSSPFSEYTSRVTTQWTTYP